jgi:hypothetical protein
MTFGDAMNLALGGIAVTRRAWWTRGKAPPCVKLVDGVVVEDHGGSVGAYTPGNNDMTAGDWQAVSTGPTEQLVLRGLADEQPPQTPDEAVSRR